MSEVSCTHEMCVRRNRKKLIIIMISLVEQFNCQLNRLRYFGNLHNPNYLSAFTLAFNNLSNQISKVQNLSWIYGFEVWFASPKSWQCLVMTDWFLLRDMWRRRNFSKVCIQITLTRKDEERQNLQLTLTIILEPVYLHDVSHDHINNSPKKLRKKHSKRYRFHHSISFFQIEFFYR